MNKIDFEFSNCGFCGSESFDVLYSAPQSSPYHNCQIVQCSDCSLIRTNPRTSTSTLYSTYTDGYYSRQEPRIDGLGNRYKIFAMRYSLSKLYPFVIPFKINKKAKICDIGCGSGQWLALMRAAYPKAELYGFEIDQETAEVASRVCQADVCSGDFLNNSWESHSFDFITFWEVLEHIHNPREVLQEVKRLIKPEGYVIFSVPNINCVYSKVFKEYWWPLAYDAHLYHFSKDTLTQLLEAFGFETLFSSQSLITTPIHFSMNQYLNDLDRVNLYRQVDTVY
jgi:2-polyprenyl-3-methyl-5-hydroxy-6-metoxy-1,4-benzoquinol methylase